MARVKVIRESGNLAIIEIVGERFPVLPARPDNLIRLFAKETLEDGTGRVVGTGQRISQGITRNVAWWADEAEVASIDAEWREAIARCSSELLATEVLRGD